jgi:hypothetical protein
MDINDDLEYDNGGTETADNYKFFYGKGYVNHHLGTGFSIHKEMRSVRFVSNRMSHKY